MNNISILIVDSLITPRELLHHLLDLQPSMEVVGNCGDTREALSIINYKHPDVVLIDTNVGHLASSECIPQIREIARISRVIGTSVDWPIFQEFMKDCGACGAITSYSSVAELLTAIRQVYRGNTYFGTIPVWWGMRRNNADHPGMFPQYALS